MCYLLCLSFIRFACLLNLDDAVKWTAATTDYRPVSRKCTFKTDVDYDHGSNDPVQKGVSSQQECCELCGKREQCAAAVLRDNFCWFKTAEQVLIF